MGGVWPHVRNISDAQIEALLKEIPVGRIGQKIINRVMPLMKGGAPQLACGFTNNASDLAGNVELILYKIGLTTKTGRFETAN